MSQDLEKWIHRISEKEMPIFKYTVNAINDVVSHEDTSTSDLSQVILRDANLTARVLRVANSVVYNTTGSTISTISRAIVYIGFNLVRDISMSLAVIDALLSGKAKEYELRLMAKSFHAAVQARDFAERRGDSASEEIFIAALLSNIGEMAFWCIAKEEGERINELIETRGFTPELAQREELGFTFDLLTMGLTKDWHLSDLLHSVIKTPKIKSKQIQDIVLSKKLSDASMVSWNSKETLRVINDISAHLGIEKNELKSILYKNVERAVEVARLYGAHAIIKYLPLSKSVELDSIDNDIDEGGFNAACPEPDPLLQLNILRDLSGMIESNPNINLILEIILEGIYRGIGLDRTVFALMSSDKKEIIAKYTLGHDSQSFMQQFHFEIEGENIFSRILQQPEVSWIKDTQAKEIAYLMNEQIRLTLASKEFFIAPVFIAGKIIGLIYADRQPSKRELEITSYESFKHFVQQANQALEFISIKKS